MLQAAFLGLLQSLTEIFPLSSKAHILLMQYLFGYKKSNAAYDVMMDCGILFALFVFFAKDMVRMLKESPILIRGLFAQDRSRVFLEFPYARLLIYIMISSLITGLVHLTFRDAGHSLGRFQMAVGLTWVLMGLFLFASRRFENGQRNIYEMNHQDAFVIGLAQGLAVFPGISRLGAALLTAMMLGMERREAARYTYLLGVPYILSAILYGWMNEVPRFFESDQTALLVSFLVAAAGGVVFLALALRMIKRGLLFLAGYYCVGMGVFTAFQALIKVAFS